MISMARLRRSSLPHVRGGVSLGGRDVGRGERSSPRPWGCFRFLGLLLFPIGVFPTSVGVFLAPLRLWPASMCLPHVRGGVSESSLERSCPIRSSPRPWGCFRFRTMSKTLFIVFPTSVGVFPPHGRACLAGLGLPHVRGGVSGCTGSGGSLSWSSPRPWGCFQLLNEVER